jgi:putative ABC transport system permease protein
LSLLLRLASLRSLTRRPSQIVLSILGVALGVCVVVAVDLAAGSARRAFELSTEAVGGRATHRIVSGGGGVGEELYTRLRLEGAPGVMAPVVEGHARTVGAAPVALRVFGIDPLAESELRPWFDLRGQPGASGGLSAFLTEADACLLSADTAQALGLEPGGRFELAVGARRVTAKLVGLIETRGAVRAEAIGDLVVCDIAVAQEWLEQPGTLTRIDLALEAGDVEALRARLPEGARLMRQDSSSAGVQQMTAAFDLNLKALSLLALLVGVFLVYNAMTFSVVQRRELIGTLRVLGVTQGQVFRTILAEALWTSVLGSVLGLFGGTWLASQLVALVARTINDLYFVLTVSRVFLDPITLAKGALMGIGATLLAALPPALEATRTAPGRTQQRSALEQRARVRVSKQALGGVLLAGLSVGAMLLPGRGLRASFAGLFLLMSAAALLAPAATVLLSKLATPPLAWAFGMLGRHAARGVTRHLSRTSVAVAALAIALSASVGMGIMVESFRATVARWLETAFRADVYVAVGGPASRNTVRLPEDVMAALRSMPGFEGMSTYRAVDVEDPAGPTHLVALDLDQRSRDAMRFKGGEAPSIWSAFEDAEAAIVSESFAWKRGLVRGDSLELFSDAGPRRFTVAGIFYDYASDQGFCMLSRRTFDRYWNLEGVSSVGVFLAPQVDADAAVAALRAQISSAEPLSIRSNRGLREQSLIVFDRTFRVTEVLRWLATGVAFIGVLSALMALQLERTREIGVLRAQGVTPGQVVELVLAETGLLGIIAGVLAIPLGLALSLVLIFVINRRSFGWTLELSLPPAVLLSALAVAVLAALLAGLYPAWKMSRISPALALRGD